MFSGGRQQDSHELLRCLVDGVWPALHCTGDGVVAVVWGDVGAGLREEELALVRRHSRGLLFAGHNSAFEWPALALLAGRGARLVDGASGGLVRQYASGAPSRRPGKHAAGLCAAAECIAWVCRPGWSRRAWYGWLRLRLWSWCG
jgi:hypothetical protein